MTTGLTHTCPNCGASLDGGAFVACHFCGHRAEGEPGFAQQSSPFVPPEPQPPVMIVEFPPVPKRSWSAGRIVLLLVALLAVLIGVVVAAGVLGGRSGRPGVRVHHGGRP